MSIKYFLSVTIDNVEFAKDFQYFVTVQFQNQKKRTDLSVNARNPIFTCNTFLFPLENPHAQVGGVVTFTACVVLEESLGKDEKGMSKILGEVDVDLGGLGLQASEGFATPVRQQLRFIRAKDGKEVPVGRFIGILKIINESVDEENRNGINPMKMRSEPFVNFPDYDPTFNFSWRVLAHVRTATNIPSEQKGSRGLTPQAFVEIGWSEKQGYPSKEHSFRTSIIESNNPFWNSCFLINNPTGKKENKQRKGHICLVLKDQNSIEDIMLFSIPVESMTPFVFYNLEVEQKSKRCSLLISLVLEAFTDPGETLYDILVTDVIINPLPRSISQMSLLLNTETQLPKVQFYRFDKTKESITRVIEFDEETKHRFFSYSISQVARLPIKASSQSEPAFVFTIPQRMINKNLVLCLLVESEDNPDANGFPNMLAAVTEPLSLDLNGLLVKRSKKKLIINFNILKKSGNPLLLANACGMTLTTHSLEDERDRDKPFQRENSDVFSKKSKMSAYQRDEYGMQRSMGLFLNQEENGHSKPSTNNQIVNRLLKQLDQKNQAVKMTAAEVIDLRKQMKLMQSQNNILRRQALQGEEQVRELVSREISDLDPSELRDKIVKLAGMYKNERGRVKQLQNTIRTLEPQVSGNMQLQSALGNLQNKLKMMTVKQNEAKKELERITLYKDTIKKQEKVISKLQKVITDSMKDIKKAREDRLQLQQYRKNGFSNTRTTSNQQVQRLQRLVAQLQQQNSLRSQPAPSDQSQLQFRLYKAQQRCSALQQQISNTSKNFAKEVARLKLVIAEKQALLDGFTLDMD